MECATSHTTFSNVPANTPLQTSLTVNCDVRCTEGSTSLPGSSAASITENQNSIQHADSLTDVTTCTTTTHISPTIVTNATSMTNEMDSFTATLGNCNVINKCMHTYYVHITCNIIIKTYGSEKVTKKSRTHDTRL